MPRACSICAHARREEIDLALIDEQPLRQLATKMGVSTAALSRHKRHIPLALLNAKRAAAESMAESVWARFQTGKRATDEIIAKACERGNHGIRLQAISRLERQTKIEVEMRRFSAEIRVALGIEPKPGSASPPHDYLRLTEEELRQYRALTLKLMGGDV